MTLALRPRARRSRAATIPVGERRLVSLVRLLLLFESAMYSAVTPVLPHYAHSLHASTAAIGMLAAGYPAGLLPGALLGGWLAGRAGVRRAAIAGLIGFGLSIAAFGFASDLMSLDLLRVVQGAFAGLIWGGGLTWVIAAVPRPRRGRTIGQAIGAATFGTLLGPLLGTAAVAAGTRPVFAAIGAAALVLAAVARRFPEPAAAGSAAETGGETDSEAEDVAAPARVQLRAAARSGGLLLGTWLITLEAMTFGATNALLPLRLSSFGATGAEIGLVFLLASAMSTALSPIAGRATDRHGPGRTATIGLAAGAPLLALLVLPHSWPLLGALTVIALGAPLTACMIPAVSMMTTSAERAGVALIVATTLVNVAYAVGETVGAPAAAALAQSSGDALPLLGVGGLMLASAAVVARRARRGRRGRRAGPASAPAPAPAPREPAARPRTRGVVGLSHGDGGPGDTPSTDPAPRAHPAARRRRSRRRGPRRSRV